MLQVVEINAIEHLESIRLRWTSLFYETRNGSFFHMLDWLKAYWQHARGRERLRVFLVHRIGEILGILPLIERNDRVAGREIRTLTYPATHFHEATGPIGPNPTVTLRAVLQHLADRPWDWQRIVLPCLGEHDCDRTPNAMTLAGLPPTQGVDQTIAQIDFNQVTETDVAFSTPELPASFEFERLRPDLHAPDDFENLEGVVRDCLSLLCQPCDQGLIEYLRDIALTAARSEMLDLCLLRSCGNVIAFSLNTHMDGIVRQLVAGQVDLSESVNLQAELVKGMVADGTNRQDECVYIPAAFIPTVPKLAARRLSSQVWEHRASVTLKDRMVTFGGWLGRRSGFAVT